ncbi:hypothetical protein [Curtobacterium sp. Leaf261]|uniref:hypothetical protein n=1 Tax=Curtobacterium sp. Leaf261 TaxID=1736311 RepID=UPI0006F27292|nr:hypothetical protein [Curtobacterium sp. Leaf261]KQO62195.1 hypothetical protein ASF23_10230 [Curtobacterium sp. Leaf261]
MTRLHLLHGGTLDGSGRRGVALLDDLAAGIVVRIAPGTFVDIRSWQRATPGERHVARMEAVLARTSPRLIVAGPSAAAAHGLPWRGEFPEFVTVIDPERATGQRRPGLLKLAGRGRSDSTLPLGRRSVTAVADTAIDVALRFPMHTSVPLLDAVLASRRVDRLDLLDVLQRRGTRPGSHRARAAVDFADCRSGSPGESLARLVMADVGAPTPVLQQEFHDADGLIGFVDFWFPEQGWIVEFDGHAKYTEDRFRAGRSPAEVVIDEKRREDRLRATEPVRGVTRLEWRDIIRPERVTSRLHAAAIPLVPVRHRTVR